MKRGAMAWRRWVAFGVVLAGLHGGSAAATGTAMGLVDAVRLGLDLDPRIATSQAQVRLFEGFWRENRGAFDSALRLDVSADYRRAELTSQALAQEQAKRDALRILTDEFNMLADDLERQLAESDGQAFLNCDNNEIFIIGRSVCSTDRDQLGDSSLGSLLGILGGSGQLTDFASQLRASLIAQSRAATQFTIDVFRATAAGTQESFDRLGVLPELEEQTTVKLDLVYSMPFRNGLAFTPSLMLEGVEDNFVGKEKSAAFGGKGRPNTFTSQVRLTLSAPLRRGLGHRFAAAPLRAAELEVRAGEADARHVATQQALATVESFWRLQAAQQRLRLLEVSQASQERLRAISEALAEGDLVPRIDVVRSEAELATIRTAVSGARRELTVARLDLARTAGLDIERLADAPTASDAFPPASTALASSSARWLIEEAVERRHDLQAERFRQQATRILNDAAEEALKPQLDLDLTVGYLGLEEEASIGQGFFGALTEDVPGLSAVFGLKVGWPVRNRVAEGQLAQSAAVLSQRGIVVRELERRIRSEVADTAGQLDFARAELDQRRRTVELYEDTLRASTEKFEAGETTLIDTLITEQRLTSARLALLAAQQRWATLLARLRFQSGSLLDFFDGEPRVVAARLDSLPTPED